MLRRLLLVFTDKELRNKLLIVLGLLIAARLLSHIPIPVLSNDDISSLVNNDAIYSLLNVVSGGSYGSLSFVMLGIGPYITATIVFQLLGVIVPKINEIQKEEGQLGQDKINRWTRFLTVPLAALNAWGVLQFLASSQNTSTTKFSLPAQLISPDIAVSMPYWSIVILSMVAGSIIMMWIGEIITELKMGNGISLLILSGIIVRLPVEAVNLGKAIQPELVLAFEKVFTNPSNLIMGSSWRQLLWDGTKYSALRTGLVYILIFFITLSFVIFVNDAVRKLTVVYSRRGASEGRSRLLDSVKATLPVKVNMAGVLPIIFAVYFILFPSIMSRFFFTANIPVLKETAQVVESYLSTESTRNYQYDKTLEIPKSQLFDFFLTGSKNEVDAAAGFNPTVGQELFAFTFSTQKDVQNSYFEGTPLNNFNINGFYPFKWTGTNLGFLPELTIRYNGILAYTFYYFILIIFFTYFYTSTIAFKTDEVSKNLQESGAFIPGFRPGTETSEYLTYISNRMNVVGSLFLATIALVPFLFRNAIQIGDGTLTAIVGGTTLLILVSVTMETLKQVEAQATIVDYDRFVK
jgi:preprotein translocase SecY subunit